jgi:4-alpha-glucanotransferase
VDFARLVPLKRDLLRTAFARYEAGHGAIDAAEVARFRQAHAGWLDDYALYAALKMAHDERAWLDWDASLVTRAPDALADAREVHARAIRMHAFWQYLFQRQWDALRQHAHARDVTLFGDIPIYVALDSADVWANQDLFQMDDNGQPIAVAGVPPDYFSETGQLWGNPLYDWGRMRRTDYAWWTRRLQRMMDLVDLVRLDHFRGLEAYWSVPAHHDTAQHGTWVDGPADALLRTLRERLGGLPLVAEDLGEITPEVYALRDRFGLPGMSLLQFAFNGDPSNQFLPHNYDRRVVAYPGTHDNNTLLGWWRTEADPDTKAQMARYLGLASEDDAPNWPAIRTLMASVAQRVVIPVQDVLELGAEARLNTPGTTGEANWTWRMTPGALAADRLDRLGALTHTFGRAAGTPAKPPASPMMVPSLADTEG